ncbi:MAG: Panacea domain-containing protein [Dermatophilaceae bacterium]
MVTAYDIQFTHDVDPLDAAAFFVRADHLRDEPDVTPMKLQKLLYLTQANYLAATGQRLFDADVETFLGTVWTRYQDWTASALRRLSHRQAPWREHYVEGAFRHPIPDDAMTTYFRHEVPARERIEHTNVVMVTPDVSEDDEDADRRLRAFLTA